MKILIYGAPFTPIFELGERLSKFHDLEYYTITFDDEKDGYFDDSIPSIKLDVGDFTPGSESEKMARDPSSWANQKVLDEVYVDEPGEALNELEKQTLSMMDYAILSSEVPDIWLVRNWADVVICLDSPPKRAIEWLDKRRKCPSCGAVYHMTDAPPQAYPLCDRCGSTILQMERDRPQNTRLLYKTWEVIFRDIDDERKKHVKNYKRVDVEEAKNMDEIVGRCERFLRKVLPKKKSPISWGYKFDHS